MKIKHKHKFEYKFNGRSIICTKDNCTYQINAEEILEIVSEYASVHKKKKITSQTNQSNHTTPSRIEGHGYEECDPNMWGNLGV